MIPVTYLEGDATQPIGTGTRYIVHVCNDVGGWGSGFVLALSQRWSRPESAYRRWFERTVGFPTVETPDEDPSLGLIQAVPVEPGIMVINMIAQRGMGGRHSPRRIDYPALEACLRQVGDRAVPMGASVHMPRIGCGLAGGRWEEVGPIVVRTLSDRDVPVYVYDLPGAKP